jgi:hypothetical protein
MNDLDGWEFVWHFFRGNIDPNPIMRKDAAQGSTQWNSNENDASLLYILSDKFI